MKIGIPREIQANEHRVACSPDEARKLIKLGHEVLIEGGAGQAAGFSDAAFTRRRRHTVVDDTTDLWDRAEMICKIRAPQMK